MTRYYKLAMVIEKVVARMIAVRSTPATFVSLSWMCCTANFEPFDQFHKIWYDCCAVDIKSAKLNLIIFIPCDMLFSEA